MSAELTYVQNGSVADMFSVKQTPWHGEGHILEEAPSLEEAIRLAGQDFEVEKQPLYLHRPVGGEDEVHTPLTTHFATVRTDNHQPLGVVGARYEVLQNREAFAILEPLLDAGLASLETGGTLRGGVDVWMQVRWNFSDPVVQEVFGREGVIPMCLLANNHSGWRAVTLENTDVRVVCANTLGWALGKKNDNRVSIKHTKTVSTRLVEEAQVFWKALTERYQHIAVQMDALRNKTIDDRQFRRYVLDVLAKLPAEAAETKRQETTRAKIQEKRDRLTHLWTHGDGHTGDKSAFEAVNGAIQSIDHDVELWKVRGSRAEALMQTGTLGFLKAQVIASVAKTVTEK